MQYWMLLPLLLWLAVAFMAGTATVTVTDSVTTCTSCRYGACSVPILEPPQEDPLIVTKTVTSTEVILTNLINTLTVGGPVFTDYTTIMIRDTLTSTEIVLSQTTQTTTITFQSTVTSFVTKSLIDEVIEYSFVPGVSTLGPFEYLSTSISTAVFTSYTILTQTRNITVVSRTTSFASLTSLVYDYIRVTESSINVVTLSFDTSIPFSTVTITHLYSSTDLPIIESAFTTVTVTSRSVISIFTSTLNTLSTPQYVGQAFTATQTKNLQYTGYPSGTVTWYTPISTILIT